MEKRLYAPSAWWRAGAPAEPTGRPPSRPARTASLLLVTALLAACGAEETPGPPEPPDRRQLGGRAAAPTPGDTALDSRPLLVFLGNSLTAGFGLDESEAFPAVIDRRLEERGISARIVNAGVSGDTSAGGLSRLEWILRQQPDIVVVGLGANDGLRGLSVAMTEENLRRILVETAAAGARPILLGLKLPPNLGPDYVQDFEAIYPRLASELEVDLVPFLLDGVAGIPELNLPDGIHPTAEGHRRIAETVLPWVQKAVEELE